MKTGDLFRIAARNLRGKWAVLPALGIAVSVFCLCFAGATWASMQQEKSQPYELSVSADGSKSLSDSAVSEISKLEDVTAATPLLKVSAIVKTGTYYAQLTLTGINASYVDREFAEGAVFPDSSVMPYIILNKAACKQFSDKKLGNDTGKQPGTGGDTQNNAGSGEKNNTGQNSGAKPDTAANAAAKPSAGFAALTSVSTTSGANVQTGKYTDDEEDAPKVDWLNAGYSLQAGNNTRWIVSKVSGILDGDDEKEEAPEAYISLAAAKALLQQSGQSMKYVGADIRIKSIGCAESVSKEVKDMGFTVTNTNDELQTKWDRESGEMTYLIVIGLFCLLCATVLMAAWRKMSLLEQRESWRMLRWIGMREKDIGRLFVIQAAVILFFGILTGIIVSLSLPSFLAQDLIGKSIFTLPVPVPVIGLCAAVCAFVCLMPLLNIYNRIIPD